MSRYRFKTVRTRARGGRGVMLLLLVLLLTAVGPARAHGDNDDPFNHVRLDQNLDAQIPLELRFQDESGRSVRLGDYLGHRPVVLTLGYYECPKLCDVVFPQTAKSLSAVSSLEIGREFDVISVSIDPGETAAAATAKEREIVAQYGQPDAAEGWHFLTGGQAAIDTLTEVVGFHYVYDVELDEYAHPAGIMVLTPGGKIARYFYGVEFPSRDLRLSLVEASAGQIGSPVDQLLLLCYRYDPVTGQYNLLITNVLRLAGLATTLILGGSVLWMVRREQTERPLHGES